VNGAVPVSSPLVISSGTVPRTSNVQFSVPLKPRAEPLE
jgi:hypothetical protein